MIVKLNIRNIGEFFTGEIILIEKAYWLEVTPVPKFVIISYIKAVGVKTGVRVWLCDAPLIATVYQKTFLMFLMLIQISPLEL